MKIVRIGLSLPCLVIGEGDAHPLRRKYGAFVDIFCTIKKLKIWQFVDELCPNFSIFFG